RNLFPCDPATGSLGTGQGNTQYCMTGGSNPINYYTGEHIFSTTDLKDSAFDGMSAGRAYVEIPQYSDTIFGSAWRWTVPQLIDMGSQVNLVWQSRHARSWTKVLDGFGNVISYTPDFFYKIGRASCR